MANNRPTNTNISQTKTNTLPTFTNTSQAKAGFLPTTRKSQMVWLATLTAITLIGQYVLLGMTGLGETRAALPTWFTAFELTLWGMRSLVEISVVVYIGMTQTDDTKESRILWRFEIVLISMIVLTVGPIWAASALQLNIVEILTYWGVITWGCGLAGISAMMLAGVAYAFKVQPNDHNSVVVTLVEYEEMLAIVGDAQAQRESALALVGDAQTDRDNALAECDKMNEYVDGLRDSFTFFSMLPASALVRVVAAFAENHYDANSLAKAFGLKPATVRGTLAKVNRSR